ncbi:hypothetical protein GCM10027447_12940 [Glycomyces halotolerans]
MKRILMALMALAAAAAFSTTFAASAGAAPATGGTAEAAATCTAVAEENRAVWAEPGLSGGTVGSVVAGRAYTAACGLVEGESYYACGSATSLWAYVNYSGDRWGYLPSTCLSWAS